MNSFIVAFFCMGLLISASASLRRSDDMDRLVKEMLYEQELENAVDVLSRARRVPAGFDPSSRACGRKLVLYVLSVCKEPCNTKTGKDIATACCGNQCSDDYIREACCPDM